MARCWGDKIYYPYNCAGFVGFNETNDNVNGTVNISRCLFVPSEVTLGLDKTFVRSRSYSEGIVNLTDCYCITSYGKDQEVLIYTIRNGEGVTVAYNGNGMKTYSVSGTRFYDTALVYNDDIFVKSGNDVSLTLSYNGTDQDYFAGFQATAGKLTEQENGDYNLTMAPVNTDINAVFIDGLHSWKGEGTGRLNTPFIIDSTDRWDDFAAYIYSGQVGYAIAYFKLTKDITIDMMVGTSGNAFRGHFDGNGHTLARAHTRR